MPECQAMRPRISAHFSSARLRVFAASRVWNSRVPVCSAESQSAISPACPGEKIPAWAKARSSATIAPSLGPTHKIRLGKALTSPSLLGQSRPWVSGLLRHREHLRLQQRAAQIFLGSIRLPLAVFEPQRIRASLRRRARRAAALENQPPRRAAFLQNALRFQQRFPFVRSSQIPGIKPRFWRRENGGRILQLAEKRRENPWRDDLRANAIFQQRPGHVRIERHHCVCIPVGPARDGFKKPRHCTARDLPERHGQLRIHVEKPVCVPRAMSARDERGGAHEQRRRCRGDHHIGARRGDSLPENFPQRAQLPHGAALVFFCGAIALPG